MAGEIGVLRLELSGEQLDELAGRIVEKLGSSRPSSGPPKRLLGQKAICAHLNVGPKRLRELVAKGMPEKRLGPKTVKYDPKECEDWICHNA